MEEIRETKPEVPPQLEFPDLSSQEISTYSLENLLNEVNSFVSGTKDFINKGLTSEIKDISDNAREYGLNECSDAVKNIFTPEIITEWGSMNYEKRQAIIEDYAKAIGEGLNIDYKGIIYGNLLQEMGAEACNSGDGYIHLDYSYLTNPSKIIGLIDTVAHEARHQLQFEAIRDPEKFGIDQATIKEWSAGMDSYTRQYATAYDPWGYFYNPVEMDARYFGESMVRELTKDLINKA